MIKNSQKYEKLKNGVSRECNIFKSSQSRKGRKRENKKQVKVKVSPLIRKQHSL
jgi:hypothetical protein